MSGHQAMRHARVCTFDDSARPCDCPPGEPCRALAEDYDDLGTRDVAVGSIWAGGGMTVQILETWPDGYSVLRLTGRGRRLKRPAERSFMPAKHFTDGPMCLVAANAAAWRESFS